MINIDHLCIKGYVYQLIYKTRFQFENMFGCAVIFTLSILIDGSNGKPTSSVSDEPERCCVPNQYTSQISTSTGMVLPDGKIYASYVSDEIF